MCFFFPLVAVQHSASLTCFVLTLFSGALKEKKSQKKKKKKKKKATPRRVTYYEICCEGAGDNFWPCVCPLGRFLLSFLFVLSVLFFDACFIDDE